MALTQSRIFFGLLIALVVVFGFIFTLSTWRNTSVEPTYASFSNMRPTRNRLNSFWEDLGVTTNESKSAPVTEEVIPPIARQIARPSTEYHLDPKEIIKQYDIMPKPCSEFKQQPFLVLIVFSRPDGFKLRQAIRKTYGSLANPVCGARLLFMFGRIYNSVLQTMLIQEADKYGDMIQSNQFDDKYRAAAHKAIHLLQWGGTFCPESTYVAKIDDDNWLNLPKYYNFLQQNQENDYVYGAMFGAGTTVIRDPASKYYVPREEFAPDLYPEYLSGVLYAFKTKFLPKVVHVAKSMPVTFNDDVYICGVVTTASNLTRKEVPDYAWDNNIHDTTCPKRDKMCIHYSKVEDFYRHWSDSCYRYEELC